MKAKQGAAAFSAGFIFAMGLALSGMTEPHRVIGFLDVFAWDPSLLYVMAGAVSVHALTYPIVRKRPSPLLDTHWHVPTRKDLNPRLMIGAGVFGAGWGLAGYCPGPAVTALASLDVRAFVFVAAMLMGMFGFYLFDQVSQARERK